MPTLTWIQERAEKRMDGAVPSPQSHRTCPMCPKEFVGSDGADVDRKLAEHLGSEHPLERPVLLIKGRFAAREETVRIHLRSADILIKNASTIEAEVDGSPRRLVSKGAAIRYLSRPARQQFLVLHLANHRNPDGAVATAEYRIKTDIFDKHELEAVDGAFKKHLANGEPSLAGLGYFVDETDRLAPAYRDGLWAYVQAILAKDGRGDSLGGEALQRAQDHLRKSVHLLEEFLERPVARAISACARLNLNLFAEHWRESGVPAVDQALKFFASLIGGHDRPAFPTLPSPQESQLRCPVDNATASVLELMFRVEAEPRAALEGHLASLERAGLMADDRTKLALLVGEAAHRRGYIEVVRKCAWSLSDYRELEAVARRWRIQ